jgi:hypothetical protein
MSVTPSVSPKPTHLRVCLLLNANPGIGPMLRFDARLPFPPAQGEDQPAWSRPALITVVVLAAGLMLIDVTRDGYGNPYYAAGALPRVTAGAEALARRVWPRHRRERVLDAP